MAILMTFTQPLFALVHGGISGGGGNVLNPVPPTYTQNPKAISRLIRDGAAHAVSYARTKQSEFQSGVMSDVEKEIFAPLFTASPNLIENLNRVILEIETKEACRTGSGEPVDGSIAEDRDNEVCISAFSIAGKVRAEDVPAQAAALVLHEYGELTGLNEDGAVQLQKAVLQNLLK